jgi:hypothetical protein
MIYENKVPLSKFLTMYRFIILLLATSLVSCGGLNKVLKYKKEDAIMSLEKGPCPGKCSVYNLHIYKNRYAVYEGIANADKYGIYAKKLSKGQVAEFKQEYEKAKFMEFDNEYPIPSLDFPTIIMTYRNDKASKTIKGSVNRPPNVIAIQKKLENLTKSEAFKLVKAYDKQVTFEEVAETRKDSAPNDIIDNEIILELNSNVFMAQWLKKYPQYDVQLVKKLSPDMSYWVVTYNKTKIAPKDFLGILKQDKDLIFVEFNKRISPREH